MLPCIVTVDMKKVFRAHHLVESKFHSRAMMVSETDMGPLIIALSLSTQGAVLVGVVVPLRPVGVAVGANAVESAAYGAPSTVVTAVYARCQATLVAGHKLHLSREAHSTAKHATQGTGICRGGERIFELFGPPAFPHPALD
jgi:hypothetical protein